jgi:hypothetical protein
LLDLRRVAVEKSINESAIVDKQATYTQYLYLSAASGKSNNEAREIARNILGENVFWDWDRKCYFNSQYKMILNLQ